MAHSGLALLVSLLAGLATLIGGLIALPLGKSLKPMPFAGALAFAAGVMIYVSFVEIYAEGLEYIQAGFEDRGDDADTAEKWAMGVGMALFFAGWLLASFLDGALHLILDKYNERYATEPGTWDEQKRVLTQQSIKELEMRQSLTQSMQKSISHKSVSGVPKRRRDEESHVILPEIENANSPSAKAAQAAKPSNCWRSFVNSKFVKAFVGTEDLTPEQQTFIDNTFYQDSRKVTRLGYFTAFVLALHNVPEGIATFASSSADMRFGIGLAIAIGIHNIPEGLAVAVPILYGKNSKFQAMLYTIVSGLAEPLGGLLAWAILKDEPDNMAFGSLFMVTAGIMTNVAAKELLFASIKYDLGNKITSPAFTIGMMIMGVSLLALELSGG